MVVHSEACAADKVRRAAASGTSGSPYPTARAGGAIVQPLRSGKGRHERQAHDPRAPDGGWADTQRGVGHVTLLRHDEGDGLTGYEVANQSGIPRSVVYATLARLEAQGACFVMGNKPSRYLPIEPATFVRGQREQGERRLVELERSLSAIPKRPRPEPVWILRGYDEVLEAATTLIGSATRSVYLSAWPRELERLRPALSRVDHQALHCFALPHRADRSSGRVSMLGG